MKKIITGRLFLLIFLLFYTTPADSANRDTLNVLHISDTHVIYVANYHPVFSEARKHCLMYEDARWRRYPAGTLFQFYPGPRTSIRFEKLIEGIQDFEKIRILNEQFLKNGNKEGLMELDHALSLIKIEELNTVPASEMVEKAKAILNKY